MSLSLRLELKLNRRVLVYVIHILVVVLYAIAI